MGATVAAASHAWLLDGDGQAVDRSDVRPGHWWWLQVVRILGVQAEEPFALGGLNQLVLALKEFQVDVDANDRAVLAPVFGGDPDSMVAVLPLTSGVLNLLAVAGQTRPLLLIIDDAHWLDRVSAQVLGRWGAG